MPDAPEQSAGAILRRLGPASILAVAALAMPPIGGTLVLVYINPIAEWLKNDGSGIVIYTAAFAVFAGLALLPTYAQAILGGWAFGLWPGFFAALIGFMGAALIGYGVARPTAGDRVVKLIEENPKWAAVRDALVPSARADGSERSAGAAPRSSPFWRTLGIVALLRLPPNSPFAITNLVLSSVRVPLHIYALGTIIGMAPRTFAAVWLGHSLHMQFTDLNEGLKKTPWWWVAAGIVLVVIVLGIIGVIANRAIERVTKTSNPLQSQQPDNRQSKTVVELEETVTRRVRIVTDRDSSDGV